MPRPSDDDRGAIDRLFFTDGVKSIDALRGKPRRSGQ